jgi:hypothetical protein
MSCSRVLYPTNNGVLCPDIWGVCEGGSCQLASRNAAAIVVGGDEAGLVIPVNSEVDWVDLKIRRDIVFSLPLSAVLRQMGERQWKRVATSMGRESSENSWEIAGDQDAANLVAFVLKMEVTESQ